MTHQAQFSINCPDCGDVELSADQLWLVLPNVGHAHYDFWCPSCDAYVRHDAGAAAVAMLSRLVAVEELEIPAEALEPRTGLPLTEDDLIDLMLGLDDDRLEAASEGV